MHTIRIVDATVKHRAATGIIEDIGVSIKNGLHDLQDAHGLSHSCVVKTYRHSERVAPPTSVLDYSVVLVDDLDDANALGYHYTNPDGTAAAKIGVGAILGSPAGSWKDGVDSVSAVIDHEVKETELDRSAARFVFDGLGRAWAEEACDAVQSSTYTGTHGVTLSNFVLPNYFIPGTAGPFDYLGILTAPLTIATGGYAILADYSKERDTFGVRAAGGEAEIGGTRFVADPRGRGLLVFRGELRPWEHVQKRAETSRTMRRLVEAQRSE